MLLRLVLCLSSLLIAVNLFGQTLTSTVDRNQISANQTLRLTVVYDGNTRSDALDLSAVQQDFDVLQFVPQSSDITVNGRRTQSTTWTLTLMPKRTGNLVIPSFSLGNIISDAIPIDVLEAGDVAESTEPMTVELSVDRNNVSVGEQVLVKVKLWAQPNLSDLAGEQLKLEDAEVLLVNQKEYGEVQNGTQWGVLEWTYAVFPQSPGSIAIPKQMFTAAVPSGRPRSLLDGLYSRRQRIAARSDSLVLNVEPAKDSSSDWFPASDVTVSSSWTSDPTNLRVGEPLTRIIEIKAESQLAAAIPPLASGSPTNFKEYRDQPALENTQTSEGVTGVRRESVAIVPSQEGAIEFPEQIILWWDINSGVWRESVLAAESYMVSAAIADESLSPPQNFETTPLFNLDSNQVISGSDAPTSSAVTNSLWKWATIVLLLVTVAQALLLVRGRSSSPPPTAVASGKRQTSDSEKSAWNQLYDALRSEDPAKIRNSLLVWSKARWPKDGGHSLEGLASRSSSEEFKTALFDLELFLFKGASGKPSTAVLSTELKKLRELNAGQEPKSALAPLYPQSL